MKDWILSQDDIDMVITGLKLQGDKAVQDYVNKLNGAPATYEGFKDSIEYFDSLIKHFDNNRSKLIN